MAGGQPRKYKTVIELESAIQAYMNNLPTKEKLLSNGETVLVPVPTISGLCYELGYESRQSFYDLEKIPEYSYTIKRARLFIEKEYEEQLQIGNTTGAIFALKNMGWKDKTETDVTTKGDKINDLSKLTYEQLKELAGNDTQGGTD